MRFFLALAGLSSVLAFGALARADAPATSPPSPPLPPIPGEWIQPEGDLGFIAPPIGSTEPRPVIVAVHGMGDCPEWECAAWRAVFGPRPFIVCPRGRPWQVNFAWSSSEHIRHSIDALLDAAEARYGAHLDPAHRIYVGFSQGAILGARVVRRDPDHYQYAIFQEGFDDALAQRPAAAALKKAGVIRVLFGCSQGGCKWPRLPIRAALEGAGIEARVNDAGPRGHTIDDAVIQSVKHDIPWLLAGDQAWSAVADDVGGGS